MSSAQTITGLRARADTPRMLGLAMSAWPPFLGAGIRVKFGQDWRSAVVTMRHNRLNANYVGTQFGGSLFAMADPFWMILVLRCLGPGYTVWDKAAEIEFLRPARSTVTARFTLDDAVVTELREAADTGEKVLRWFTTDITTDDGMIIARVRKQLYVRKKRPGVG